jgi:DNA-binding IscR family transcriptional regulator
LIKALPGPKGGLRLSRSAGSITVLNIVEAIEGKVELNPNPMNPNRMNRDSGDYIAPVWDDLQSKILNYLDGINLEQLLEGDTLQVKLMPISSNIGQNSD